MEPNGSALVTGASRGIGRGVAIELARRGFDVIATMRDPATGADLPSIGGLVGTIAVQALDVTDPDTFEMPVALRVLVNNAGVTSPAMFSKLTDETFRRTFDIHVMGTFHCTQAALPHIPTDGTGRVINIASISGLIANRGVGGRHYETAKAAVIQFTRATAADWAPRGVTVNAICPGLFMTEPNLAWSKSHPEMIAAFVDAIPMGRAGEPDEIAPLAVYLASPASSYVTGAAFVIDGGYTLW